jgi:hypothetical protein
MRATTLRLIAATLTLATFVQLSASAQSTAEKTLYSQKEVAQLTREAHTSEQYQALASYFRSQEKLFNEKAIVEKQEWDRRSTITVGLAAKYPKPADSARNLYQYYSAKADEMATRAADYEHRAQDTASRGTAAIDADSQTPTTK